MATFFKLNLKKSETLFLRFNFQKEERSRLIMDAKAQIRSDTQSAFKSFFLQAKRLAVCVSFGVKCDKIEAYLEAIYVELRHQ
jgi:hypothetical protein